VKMSQWVFGAHSSASLSHHVLFLRPFVADSIPADRNTFVEAVRNQAGWMWPATTTNLQRFLSQEVCSRIGPMITVANPRDGVPAVDGTQTIIAPEADWQPTVAELARSACCIILELGGTEGFCWELNHLRHHVELRKVFGVLDLEGWHEKHWLSFCRTFQAAGFTLPSHYPGDGTVIRFEPDGRGVIVVKHAQNAQELVCALQSCLGDRPGQLSGADSPNAPVPEEILKTPSTSSVPTTSALATPMPVVEEDSQWEMRQWRKRLLRGAFSGGAAGCLLVCLSFLGLMVGLALTIWAIMKADVQVTGSGNRGVALIVSLPSIGLALAAFYAFSPLLYRLHLRLQRRRPPATTTEAANSTSESKTSSEPSQGQ
jgi:hypothetical protein